MDEYFVRQAQSEISFMKFFRKHVKEKTSEVLKYSGGRRVPAMLYVMSSIDDRFRIESTRISAHFVDSVIHGYNDDVLAFAYVHKMFHYNMPPEEMRDLINAGGDIDDMEGVDHMMAVYYEDKLMTITDYYNVEYDVLSGEHVIADKPKKSPMYEMHPANINLSKLYIIN